MLSYVRRRVKLILLKSPNNRLLKKTFLSLDLLISKNILLIGEAKVSKSKLMHTVSQSKSIFAIEKKAIVSCYVKSVLFLLGRPVKNLLPNILRRNSVRCSSNNSKKRHQSQILIILGAPD